jgi:hypothetical protein
MKYNVFGSDKPTPISPPCRKKIYDTREAAMDAIQHMESVRHVKLSAYQCSICGFWHLTSGEKDKGTI